MENAIDFLNLSTQNALLFNSFVGGAAIVERSDTGLDAIRINDKFFDTIGMSREAYQAVPHECLGIYEEKYKRRFKKMIDDAKKKNVETTCTLHWKPLKSKGLRKWIQYRARYLATAGDSDIFYVAVDNITQNMHLLHENEKINRELMAIMDNVPCGILTMRQEENERRLKFVNKGLSDILGYSKNEFSEIFSVNRDSFFEKTEYKKYLGFLNQTIEARRNSFQIRLKLKKKDGTTVLVFHQGVVNYDENGLDVVLILLDMNQKN